MMRQSRNLSTVEKIVNDGSFLQLDR